MSGKLATEAADHELDVVWIIRLYKHSSLVEIKGPNGKILQNVIHEPSMCVPIPAIPSLLQSTHVGPMGYFLCETEGRKISKGFEQDGSTLRSTLTWCYGHFMHDSKDRSESWL